MRQTPKQQLAPVGSQIGEDLGLHLPALFAPIGVPAEGGPAEPR
jgi:hypothetical protein